MSLTEREFDFVPREAGEILSSSPWGQHEFACCLTHDIDFLRKYQSPWHWGRRMAADVLRRKDLGLSLRRFRQGTCLFNARDVFAEDLKWLITMEKRLGVSASYFFMATDKEELRGGYLLDEAAEFIKEVEESGMEAGLHAGFGTQQNIEKMREEKERFDALVENTSYGVRQHHLHFNAPETWRIQAELGILYDCSFGSVEREGFPSGAYYPFRPIDPETGEAMGIWEIPLTIMDVTLARYRGLSPDMALEVVKQLVMKARAMHGVICVLWHNSSLDNVDWPGWREVYEIMLEFILEQDGWIASGREILSKWQESDYDLKISNSGGCLQSSCQS